MGLTEEIASFVADVSFGDFPPEAIFAARHGMVDCAACALAGANEKLVAILSDFCRQNETTGDASIIGSGLRLSAPAATLVNGAMSHALDYDDICPAFKGHPSVVCFPAALATGEQSGASGRDVMLAYMIAVEVGCAVSSGLSVDYSDDLGWHPTAPVGTIAAAAAASRLLALNAEETAMALSLAASNAGGLRENFGTMTKPYHAGNAARGGVTAALLVKRGFTASTSGIEGRFGFLHAFSGGRGEDTERPLARLGRSFHLKDPGLTIKQYPCCGSAHSTLDACFQLREKQDFDYRNVSAVEVFVNFDPPRALIHSNPQTTLEGKFSMEYCLAAALIDGRVGFAQFQSDAMVTRPEIRSLFPRISMKRNPGFEGRPAWAEPFTEIRIQLDDGAVLSHRVERGRSGPVVGATEEGMRRKFMDCATLALPSRQAHDAFELMWNIEQQDAIRTVAMALTAH